MLTLDIAISTCKPEGIKRVEKLVLPSKNGVRYIISWQDHENAPVPLSLSQREDIKIFRYNNKGLSNNRNNSIDKSTADIILIADDDIVYELDFAEKILSVFESDNDLDLATFKLNFSPQKSYPLSSCLLKLPLPKNYYVSSVEIAFRKSKIKDLRFYPELGLGTEMKCGEEELFILSALKRGLVAKWYDLLIGTHIEETTGNKVTQGNLYGQGFVTGVYYPKTAFIRLFLKSYRISRYHKIGFAKVFNGLMKGYLKYRANWHNIPQRYKY